MSIPWKLSQLVATSWKLLEVGALAFESNENPHPQPIVCGFLLKSISIPG
jgi:hypothetical protein